MADDFPSNFGASSSSEKPSQGDDVIVGQSGTIMSLVLWNNCKRKLMV
jgi:hypothetical protein